MAFVEPTPADIREDFVQFAALSDNQIQRRIDRTSSWVDTSWFEGDYTWGKELLTAHFLTLDKLGTTAGGAAGAVLNGITRLRSGSLDVAFSDAAANAAASGDMFMATAYGRQWLALARKKSGGVAIAAGDCSGIAGQATDVPWAWSTNGFGL